jgi:hypothetical protein
MRSETDGKRDEVLVDIVSVVLELSVLEEAWIVACPIHHAEIGER